MTQISLKLSATQARASGRAGHATAGNWLWALRRWIGTVLKEQRALDEQVTAPLFRRYRQHKSRTANRIQE